MSTALHATTLVDVFVAGNTPVPSEASTCELVHFVHACAVDARIRFAFVELNEAGRTLMHSLA